MKVEITSYEIKKNGFLIINAIDLEHVSDMIDQRRDPDHDLKQIEFYFETRLKSDFKYVRDWLHRQKIIHKLNPSTYGEALNAVIGTVTDLNSKYIAPFS